MVRAPVDHTLDVMIKSRDFLVRENHRLITYEPAATKEGRRMVDVIKERYPDAVIIGSMMAAQVFREEVVCPVPIKGSGDRTSKYKYQRQIRSDCFTIFKKEDSNG